MFGKKKKNKYEEVVEEGRDEFDVDYNDDEDFEKQRRSAQSRFRTRRRELLPFLVEEEKNDEDDCCINDDFARDERKEESTAEGMDTR